MPTRPTHILFALLLFLLLQQVLHFDVGLAVFAGIGALLPDLDLRFMHRRLLHNVWALLIFAWIGIHFGIFVYGQALAFGLGWASHLIADSLTHMGVMPLWPIPKPRFKGIVRTGGMSELALMLGLLILIGVATGAVRFLML